MKKLFKALFDFQAECPPIYKGTENPFTHKRYADLNAYIEGSKPYLQKHGLGVIQPINGDSIKTILFHFESGETLESESNLNIDAQLKGMNIYQVEGAAITYKRRYAFAAILGLATSDNDMSGDPEPETPNHPELKLVFNASNFEKLENDIIDAKSKGQSLATIKKRILITFDGITAEAVTLIKNAK